MQCDRMSGCVKSSPVALPHLAWRMLALTAQYEIAPSPKLLKDIYSTFEDFQSKTDGVDETASLWIVLRAYEATREPAYLKFFMEGASQSAMRLKLQVSDQDLTERMAMSNVTLGFTLLEASKLFSDPALLKSPAANASEGSLYGLILSAWPPLFKEQSDRLFAFAEALSDRGPVALKSEPSFKRQSCWIALANSYRYEISKDGGALREAREFFKRADFVHRPAADYDFGTLQMILPCADALKRLSKYDESFKGDLKALIERHILTHLDSRSRKLCQGDGGILAGVPKDGDMCLNMKSTSDTAWTSYLLGDMDEEFLLDEAQKGADVK